MTVSHPLLSLKNIKVTFGGVRALKGVSFEVNPGEVHCLAGENGCGKSTLIKVITGVYKPEAGAELSFAGEIIPPALRTDAADDPDPMLQRMEAISRQLRKQLGMRIG